MASLTMFLVCTPLERLGAFRVVRLGVDCTPFGLPFLQSGPDRWCGDDVISLSLFNGFWSHCTLWDLSSPTRDQTHAPCKTSESWSLDCQGSPCHLLFFFLLFPGARRESGFGILTPSLQTHLLSQLPASLPFVNCRWHVLRAKNYLGDGATRQR